MNEKIDISWGGIWWGDCKTQSNPRTRARDSNMQTTHKISPAPLRSFPRLERAQGVVGAGVFNTVSDRIQTKVCTGCLAEKPVSEFHTQKLGRYGVTASCKPCKRQINKAWQDNNPEKCRLKMIRWRNKNKDHMRALARTNYQKRRKDMVAKARGWQLSNPHSKIACGKRYRSKNPDKIRSWREKNYPLILSLNATRRARRLRAVPQWLSEDHRTQIRALYSEARRLTKETGIPHAVDHIMPLKHPLLCGLHVPWNLRVITGAENSIKNNSVLYHL